MYFLGLTQILHILSSNISNRTARILNDYEKDTTNAFQFTTSVTNDRRQNSATTILSFMASLVYEPLKATEDNANTFSAPPVVKFS